MHALELILAFHAWATARPELETRLASEILEKEMDAVAAIEAEQGPYSFDIVTLHQQTEFPRSDACAPCAVCCQHPRRPIHCSNPAEEHMRGSGAGYDARWGGGGSISLLLLSYGAFRNISNG